MDDLAETSELLAFVRTVETGSVSRAARELGLPRPTVSRRLARLEERLDARLLRRSTRRLALTDAGHELFRHARAVVTAVKDAEAAVRRADGEIRGLLRVSVPPSSDDRFSSMLLAFLAKYPGVRLEVSFTTQHVDLVASGYDVAIRAGTELDPGLVARHLARAEVFAVASPAYLARAGTPTAPEDLSAHACLVGFVRGERPQTYWPLLSGGHVRVEGRVATNDLALLRRAALAGMGIALLPGLAVDDDLQSGALVRVLPGIVGSTSRIAVVYPERQFLPPVVRAFVDFVAASAADLLAPEGLADGGHAAG
jgi:DNA-binding transcriptional LysR family regulator